MDKSKTNNQDYWTGRDIMEKRSEDYKKGYDAGYKAGYYTASKDSEFKGNLQKVIDMFYSKAEMSAKHAIRGHFIEFFTTSELEFLDELEKKMEMKKNE